MRRIGLTKNLGQALHEAGIQQGSARGHDVDWTIHVADELLRRRFALEDQVNIDAVIGTAASERHEKALEAPILLGVPTHYVHEGGRPLLVPPQRRSVLTHTMHPWQKKPLRLHVLIDSLTWGGAETLLADFARGAEDAGIEVTVGYLSVESEAAGGLRRVGIEPKLVEVTSLTSRSDYRRVRDHLAKQAPDILHTHLGGSDFLGGLRGGHWAFRRYLQSM